MNLIVIHKLLCYNAITFIVMSYKCNILVYCSDYLNLGLYVTFFAAVITYYFVEKANQQLILSSDITIVLLHATKSACF